MDEYHPSLKVACDAAARFIADMERGAQPYWLTFSGLQGAGKTMLARKIFDESKSRNPGRHSLWVGGEGIYEDCNRRPWCIWLHASAFASRMRDGEYDLAEYLRHDFIVVIDDLGAVRDKTEFVAEGLYRLADQRSHRWMIWTTNLSLSEISTKLDPRISSRLIRDDNRLVTITAPDYALRKK